VFPAAAARNCIEPQTAHPGYASNMRRLLIGLGLLIALVALLWPWLSRVPLGRLPGDIVLDRPGFRLFVPFTTMLIVSLVASLVIWLFRR